MTDSPTECDQFPAGSTLRAICEGQAGLSVAKTNAYRKRWGMKPLDSPEPDRQRKPRSRPKRAIERRLGGMPLRPAKPRTKRKAGGCCGGGGGKRGPRPNGWGPGSQLLKLFEAAGVPHCDECRSLAGQMDRWGKAGCQRRLPQIVDEILPRARAWVADHRPVVHRLLSVVCLEDTVLKLAIRRKVQSAIDAAPDKRPKTKLRPPFRRPTPRDPILEPTIPVWRTESKYRCLADSLLAKTEVLVKSFMRHRALLGLVQSIRRYYPDLPIRIVDDSPLHAMANDFVRQVRTTPRVSWHEMPFDSGLTAGRNLAVQSSPAEYVVLCDDDMVFTSQTDLSALLIGLDQTGADIFGGLSRRKGTMASNWCGRLSIAGGVLRMSTLGPDFHTVAGIRFRWTDITYNFFTARRAFLLQYPWDDRWKISNEHLDSFLSWQAVGAKVAYTVDCLCDETNIANSREYSGFRNRHFSQGRLNQKWGIVSRRTIGVTRFPGL